MGEVINLRSGEFALECKCGFQIFFIIVDDKNRITHFECSKEGCSEIIEFDPITLTEKNIEDQ